MVIYKGKQMKITTIEEAIVLWIAYRNRIPKEITVSVMMLFVDSFIKHLELGHEEKKQIKMIILEREFDVR